MPYPGTKMYHMAQEKGLITGDPWKDFAENPTPDFIIPYWEENFTRTQLEEILSRAFKRFYLRPGYILNRLRNLKSFGELSRKIKAGYKVILRI